MCFKYSGVSALRGILFFNLSDTGGDKPLTPGGNHPRKGGKKHGGKHRPATGVR